MDSNTDAHDERLTESLPVDSNETGNVPAPVETASSYYNLGNTHLSSGEYARATEVFSRALEIDPRLSQAYNNRGNAYRKLGDNRQAFEDYNAAIAIDPSVPEAYNNRGNARRKLGEIAESIPDYSRAIQINPSMALAFNNRGNAFAELDDVQSALSNYDQAIHLDPTRAEPYNNRGVLRYKLGDRPTAMGDFQQALQMNPEYLEARINLSCVQVEIGEVEQAMAGLEQASRLFYRQGDDHAYAQVKKTIARIKTSLANAPTPFQTSDEEDEQDAQDSEKSADDGPFIAGKRLVSEVKKLLKAGNARKITIKNTEGKILLEVPLSMGAAAGAGLIFLAPELIAIATVAALVSKVQVHIERDE